MSLSTLAVRSTKELPMVTVLAVSVLAKSLSMCSWFMLSVMLGVWSVLMTEGSSDAELEAKPPMSTEPVVSALVSALLTRSAVLEGCSTTEVGAENGQLDKWFWFRRAGKRWTLGRHFNLCVIST